MGGLLHRAGTVDRVHAVAASHVPGHELGAETAQLVLGMHLVIRVVIVTIGILAVHGYMRNRRLEEVVARTPWWLTGLVWAGMLFAIVITQGSGNAFIYFQF